MKPIFLFFSLLFATQFLVAQSFTIDFKMKKTYDIPYVFNDSAAQKTYFVFLRNEGFAKKASLCIIETDSVLNILRQSETNCGPWDGNFVFKDINATHLTLYFADYRPNFIPFLRKLEIDKENLSYNFGKVIELDKLEDLSYIRCLSDGKRHYLATLFHNKYKDSLSVLKIENNVVQSYKGYALPDLSDINETWHNVFKGKNLFKVVPPLSAIDPLGETDMAAGASDKKLYLSNDKLVFSLKKGRDESKMEKIVTVNCQNATIDVGNVYFTKPNVIGYHTLNAPSTASFVIDDYLFQAWSNGEKGILIAKTLDSFREVRRWEFSPQDTFGFKNSAVFMKKKGYWFADKKKPFKDNKELSNLMRDDGLSLTARKRGDKIEMQFGSYKYVDQSNTKLGLSIGFGLIGGLVAYAAFPNYEQATYFWLSLNREDLSQPEGAVLPTSFDALSEVIENIPSSTLSNPIFINGRRAFLYQRDENELLEHDIKRYHLLIEEK